MSDGITAEAAAALGRLPAVLRAPVELWLGQLEEHEPGAFAARDRAALPADTLLRLVATSEYAAGWLLRDWAWFAAAAGDGRLARPPAADFAALAGEPDEAAFAAALRRLRHRTLVSLWWREQAGLADVEDTLAGLSGLADGLVAASVDAAARRIADSHGLIRGPDGEPMPLVVVAMGKLGGRELNFSSDVDLVFLYPGDGESDGARPLPAQEYFGRAARRVVALLEEPTAEGFAYRVDTRLRPFGDSGPPVASFAALESYLLNHGRGWERYAWLKARVVAPTSGEHGARLVRELIEPFVYRRYLDYGVFESLREMKALITAEVERRDMADNVKLGPGGIREIEFIVQSLQLVRGGSVRGLRSTSLLHALRQLEANRGMTRADCLELRDAYCYLRRLENALQAMRDRQVHELPAAAADRARLALAMGRAGWDELAETTRTVRATVNRQFAAVAFRDESAGPDGALEAAVSARFEQGGEDADWRSLFERHGFSDAEALAAELSAFLARRATRQADATAQRRLQRLVPSMIGALASDEHALTALRRLLGILGQVLRRSAYLALLNENPAVLERLVAVCEQSAYLAEEIARYPLLLDEMFDPRLYTAELSATALRDDLAARLANLGDPDSERRVEVLAQFQRAALFRIAAADFAGDLPVMKVSDRLTDLAEIVLDEALGIAWRDVVTQHGTPRFRAAGESRRAGLGVIAYGKLGGIELSYGSDLDLVFLHDSRGDAQQTDGERSLENGMFFVRLARRLTHFLTTQTPSGALYEVDTRLRPSGRAGLLVTSIDAFERYQRENAWTWEHQALLRERPVASIAGVGRAFERVRAETLIDGVNRETLREDVRKMRAKMRAELDRSDAGTFDLKQGEGGIGDVEFLVQYLVLAHAAGHPAVIHYPDNIRQLGTLGAAGCLPLADVRMLQDVYRAYRTRLHRLLLDEQPPRVAEAEFRDERAAVGALWRRLLG